MLLNARMSLAMPKLFIRLLLLLEPRGREGWREEDRVTGGMDDFHLQSTVAAGACVSFRHSQLSAYLHDCAARRKSISNERHSTVTRDHHRIGQV